MRLLVTVTFNQNQLRSHLLPLIALDEVESITLVSDVPPLPLPKVRALQPSRRQQRLHGRAGAKLHLCRRLVVEERYDWVLGFNFVPHGFNAQHAARRAGTRSLYHMIGGELEWLGGGYRSDNRILGRLPRPVPALERAILRQIRKASVVATMGPRVRGMLLERGFDPDRVVVLPPASDTERFAAPADGPPPEYDLVAVGRLSPVKRTGDLLDALARLRPQHPGLRVALAGEGPLRGELERRAAELGLAGAVDFLGQVDRIEDVYARSRAFVITSSSEGMPIAMLDAMAFGLPVVASDVGEIGSLVDSGRNGLLYPAGDVAGLAERLRTLLDDPGLARALGDAGRRDVVGGYSVDAVAGRYRDILLGPGY